MESTLYFHLSPGLVVLSVILYSTNFQPVYMIPSPGIRVGEYLPWYFTCFNFSLVLGSFALLYNIVNCFISFKFGANILKFKK